MLWFDSLLRDIRQAGRVLAKSPGFAAIAVISIALGTGANVAVFSAADALLLRPLPVAEPDRLVAVGARIPHGFAGLTLASYPDYLDVRDRARSFDGLVALVSQRAGVSTGAAAPPQVRMVTMVSDNFFRVLGVEPHIGRGFHLEEVTIPGRSAVAVLSYGLWQQAFSGDPGVLGRTLRIAGLDHTIVGVAPEVFTGTDPRYVRDAAYVPIAMWRRIATSLPFDPLAARDYRNVTVKGRLRPGVTLTEARTELSALALDLERAYPETNRHQTLTAQTELAFRFARTPIDSGLVVILSVLAIAVLCVACANVAGLLASRAPVRTREIAMRLAIGAARWRLVRQLVIESLALALAGGIAGLAVGGIGIGLLRQIRFPSDVMVVPEMRLDERAFAFSLLAALVSAFVFGLGPAFQTTRVDLSRALKTTDASPARARRVSGRSVLVALQVALSLVLLTIAAFAFDVFRREFDTGPGFRTDRIAKLTIVPAQARYTEEDSIRFFERCRERAERIGGAGAIGLTSAMPLFSFEQTAVVPEGHVLPEGQIGVRPHSNTVDEGYFAALEIPILSGRPFLASDTAAAPAVAVVNESFARRYWPGERAIGKRLRRAEQTDWITIVGIARDAKYIYIAEPPQDAIYFPFRQHPRGQMVLLARTTGGSSTLLEPLREIVRDLDADVPVYDVQTMEAFYAARATSIGQVVVRMIGGMGLMGVALTMVGLYGLASYSVARRTREIGIRIAIGATRARVLRLVMRQGLAPAWWGLAAGLGFSEAAARVLTGLIPVRYEHDPTIFVLLGPLLLAVAVVASLVPARRAARVHFTIALRCE